MTMMMRFKQPLIVLAMLCLAIAWVVPASFASAEETKRPTAKPATGMADAVKQVQALQEQAKSLGLNWTTEAYRLKEAHLLVFERYGWTSESDQFALNLVNEVSNVEPWNTQRREEIFLEACRGRFGLSQDQVDLLGGEMRRESIAFTMKHFDKLMPVAMEAVQARVSGKPFSAEMVQNWATQLDPVMGEALEMVQRVQKRLESTMTDTQKALLAKDMDAVLRRHNDLSEQMQRWKQGKWTPYDFGLQNDPAYAANLPPDPRAGNAASPATPRSEQQLILEVTRRDQSLWEKYVAKFVNDYDCDEKQRIAANAILRDSEAEAHKHLAANGEELAMHEKRAKESPVARKREYHARKAEQLRKPIERIFDRMCRRLETQVLNREQRRKLAADKAKDKSSSKTPRGKTASAARG